MLYCVFVVFVFLLVIIYRDWSHCPGLGRQTALSGLFD